MTYVKKKVFHFGSNTKRSLDSSPSHEKQTTSTKTGNFTGKNLKSVQNGYPFQKTSSQVKKNNSLPVFGTGRGPFSIFAKNLCWPVPFWQKCPESAKTGQKGSLELCANCARTVRELCANCAQTVRELCANCARGGVFGL